MKMKSLTISALFASTLLFSADSIVTIESNSIDVSHKVNMQNDEILKKYTENNSNVSVDSLPPFATMADVKMAVAKLISEIKSNQNDISNINGKIDEKTTEIKYISNRVEAIEIDTKRVKDLTLTDANVSEDGKTTLTGVDNKINALSIKKTESKPIIKHKKKGRKIFAPAINCNCSIINAESVNLRSAPYKCAEVVGYLQKGDNVKTIAQKNQDWSKVVTKTGKVGLVWSDLLKK